MIYDSEHCSLSGQGDLRIVDPARDLHRAEGIPSLRRSSTFCAMPIYPENSMRCAPTTWPEFVDGTQNT